MAQWLLFAQLLVVCVAFVSMLVVVEVMMMIIAMVMMIVFVVLRDLFLWP